MITQMENEYFTTAILGDVEARNLVLFRDGKAIFEFPTEIAEVARLDDRVFVILAVPDPKADRHCAGTNLWCVDTDGHLLWKARDLNEKRTAPDDEPRMYNDLRMFDRAAPKILCDVGERQSSAIWADTGRVYARPNEVDWTQPYKVARAQSEQLAEQEKSQMFLGSARLRRVSERVPECVRSKWPSFLMSQPSP